MKSQNNFQGKSKSSWGIGPSGFIEFFQKYRRRITHESTGLPFPPSSGKIYTIEQLAFSSGRWLELAVACFAPFCLCLFLLSFYWNPYRIISSCSIAGLIGFGTNWVAIKMLFLPKQARPIFGQGLIPAQRDQLIEKITCEVFEKLINEQLIRSKIEETGVLRKFTHSLEEQLRLLVYDGEFNKDAKALLVNYVQRILHDQRFREQLKDILVQNVVRGSLKQWVLRHSKKVWEIPYNEIVELILSKVSIVLVPIIKEMDIVLEHLPRAIEDHSEAIQKVLTEMQMGLIQEINIRSIITGQLESITSDDLEKGFREFSDDKLSFITIIGGLLGFTGGFVILWPLQSLVIITLAILALFAIDKILYSLIRAKKDKELNRI